MELTGNEKKTLQLLLENGRMSDTEVGEKLRISSTAARKIRKKLENEAIIEGYSPRLNIEKIGVTHFALAHITVKDKFWKDFTDISSLNNKMKDAPEVIFSCTPQGSNVSVITLYGFRDSKEMDRYFHLIKVRFNEYMEINKSYHFSSLNLLKNSSGGLFSMMMDDKPIIPSYSFKK